MDYGNDILRQRLKIPLAETMSLLGDLKAHLPSIKVTPNKISDIELDIFSIKDMLRQKYVTFQQLQTMNDTFRLDLEALMDNTTQQTIKRVIQTIEDKVPFEYLQNMMKHKASLDSIKETEKLMVKVRAEMDHMAERMHAIEMDNHRYKHTFDGITRQDVENMLTLKVEKGENERKLTNIDTQIKWLTSQIQSELLAKQDLFKKMEKSIHDMDQHKETQKKTADNTEKIEKMIQLLAKRQSDQDVKQGETGQRVQNLEDIVQRHAKKLRKQKETFNKDGLMDRFKEQDSRINQMQDSLMKYTKGLFDDLQKQIDDLVKNRNVFQMLDGLTKRVIRNENSMLEMQQENEQLRMLKKKQLETMDHEMKSLFDLVHSKVLLRLSNFEKEAKEAVEDLLRRIMSLDSEFQFIKGPLIDEFNNNRSQNMSILRELERLQANYRELISDYVKTLDAKLQEMITSPSKFISNMQTQDELIRNQTKTQLHKLSNQDFIHDNAILQNLIHQQLLNIKSNVSLNTSPSDLSMFLKHQKVQLSKKRTQRVEDAQESTFHQQMGSQSHGLQSPVSSLTNKLGPYQDPTEQNTSAMSIHERQSDQKLYTMKKRTIRSAIGSMRRNNKTNYTSLGGKKDADSGIFEIQVNHQQAGSLPSSSHRKPVSIDPEAPIGNDYSVILNNAVQLKQRKAGQSSTMSQRRRQARTTLNSSIDPNRTVNSTRLNAHRAGANSTTLSGGFTNNDITSADINIDYHMFSNRNIDEKYRQSSVKETIETIESHLPDGSEIKQKRMLEKQLPVTLHRFKHLMNNDK